MRPLATRGVNARKCEKNARKCEENARHVRLSFTERGVVAWLRPRRSREGTSQESTRKSIVVGLRGLRICFLPVLKLPGGLVAGMSPDIFSNELAWTCVLTVATCQKVINALVPSEEAWSQESGVVLPSGGVTGRSTGGAICRPNASVSSLPHRSADATLTRSISTTQTFSLAPGLLAERTSQVKDVTPARAQAQYFKSSCSSSIDHIPLVVCSHD